MQNLEPLLARFGLVAPREEQKPILNAVATGQDVLVVMATGGGKSLCYQLPAQICNGITIVISPLLALMRDQVASLKSHNFEAYHLSSAQDENENHENLTRLRQIKKGLLYISPEQFAKDSLHYWLKDLTVSRVVVDEAHCFSNWGHDFRPDYRLIPQNLKRYPKAKLSAFTATASPQVVTDLRENLFLKPPAEFIHPPRRKNIKIRFLEKSKPRQQLLKLVKDETTIIYAATRSKTQVLAQALREQGYQARHYHAGLENAERQEIEQEFIAGHLPIITATNAFGMGIDHPSIRHIIHADLPLCLESYVQEIGRAGRDGNPAKASCLYGTDDFEIRFEQIETSIENEERREHLLSKLRHFYELARQNSGWDEIDAYFGFGKSQSKHPNAQDHLTLSEENNTLIRLKRWRYTTAQQRKIPPYFLIPDDVLNRIAEANPKNLDELAQVKGVGASRLEGLGGGILEALGFEALPSNTKRRQIALQGQGELFERLSKKALELRKGPTGQDKPIDCSAKLIARLTDAQPTNMDALARIKGMTPQRVKRFGEAFLLELQNECR